jgi:hypothetical protein
MGKFLAIGVRALRQLLGRARAGEASFARGIVQ